MKNRENLSLTSGKSCSIIKYKECYIMTRIQARKLIEYNPNTGEIKRVDNREFTYYIKNNTPYTCLFGKNYHLLNLLWSYEYDNIEKGCKVFTLTENIEDFRLFNLVHPGKPNYKAAAKISRYLHRLNRNTPDDEVIKNFGYFDK